MTIQDFAKKNGFVKAVKAAKGDGYQVYLLESTFVGIVGCLQFAVVENGKVSVYPIGNDTLAGYLKKATKRYEW